MSYSVVCRKMQIEIPISSAGKGQEQIPIFYSGQISGKSNNKL